MNPTQLGGRRRAMAVGSVLMTRALQNGNVITAQAYAAKTKRGGTTCAGGRCGAVVVFQRAHRRLHPHGYVEMFAGFRLSKGARHTAHCDIDLQIDAKVRGKVIIAPKAAAAAAIVMMAMASQGPGRSIDERILQLRWDAGDTPPRVTVASPSVTFMTTRWSRGGRGGGHSGQLRPRRIASAADIERERLAIAHAADPIAASKALLLRLGNDPELIGWRAFFHNWQSNTPRTVERIVSGIEHGEPPLGIAFVATIDGAPQYRRGAWAVPCCQYQVADGKRKLALWVLVPNRAIAAALVVGKTYVFAGPDVVFERVTRRGVVYENILVGVLSARWIAPSAAPVSHQQAESFLRKTS
jgi:hypothetical protein